MKKNITVQRALPALAAALKSAAALLLTTAALASCSSDELPAANADGAEQELLISASGIVDVQSKVTNITRAKDNEWETNDQIGVYVVKDGKTSWTTDNKYTDPWGTYFDNRQFTVQNPTAGTTADPKAFLNTTAYTASGSGKENTARLYLTADNVDVYAYYPYTSTATPATIAAGSVTYDATTTSLLTVDVSSQTSQQAIDLMRGTFTDALNKNGNCTAALTFQHKLSKFVFNLKAGKGITADQIASAVLTMDALRCQATYDVVSGAYSVLHDDTKAAQQRKVITAANATLTSTASGAGYTQARELIALPNTTANYGTTATDYPAARHRVALKIADHEFDFYINTATTAPIISAFLPGYKYIFNITVDNTGITLMSYYITPWSTALEEELEQTAMYRNMPLTFEAVGTGATVKYNGEKLVRTSKASVNGGAWSEWKSVSDEAITLPAVGDKVQYIGSACGKTFTLGGGQCKVYGNIMSMENGCESGTNQYIMDYQTDVELYRTEEFKNCFYGCTTLTDASNLVLPATTLTESCYESMFEGCTALTAGPKVLPATTLAQRCYSRMFQYCEELLTAPALPATQLADWCYFRMFNECKKLTAAPELPATTLAASCYRGMFGNCYTLTEAPALPATDLTGCTNCYYWMFQYCTGLTTAPALPATTLAQGCYWRMFMDCTSLKTAPDLPATTLAEGCYWSMFKRCTSLQTAPDLPATTLVSKCYNNMFENCTALQGTIKLGVTDANTVTYGTDYDSYDDRKTGTVSNMFLNAGTASSTVGQVKCTSAKIAALVNMNAETPAISPKATKGFRATPLDYQYLPLTIHMDAAGALSIDKEGDLTRDCSFRTRTVGGASDGAGVWSDWSTDIPTVNGQDAEVQIYGPSVTQSNTQYLRISSTEANHHVFGNVMSLENDTEPTTATAIQTLYDDVTINSDYCFSRLFETNKESESICSLLTDASNLVLPATTLTKDCYFRMFHFSDLRAIPKELPATTLAVDCYRGMFATNTNLETVPLDLLPATTLVNDCYNWMFRNCTSLTQGPDLPATTLASGCYRQLFYKCSNLKTIRINAASGQLTNTNAREMMIDAGSGIADGAGKIYGYGPDIITELTDNCHLNQTAKWSYDGAY